MEQQKKIKNFRDLIIWQKSMELGKNIYLLANKLPKDELYGLNAQIKKCAVSIPSNIAEGFNRFHNKEYIHFLYISLGSCAELETQIEFMHMVGLICEEDKNQVISQVSFISGMTGNLLKKLTIKRTRT